MGQTMPDQIDTPHILVQIKESSHLHNSKVLELFRGTPLYPVSFSYKIHYLDFPSFVYFSFVFRFHFFVQLICLYIS
ncbi:hypothetical protein Hdeb2414_s0184g00826421 [Helianthus debilis subsp. tardiflorus]